MGRSVVLGYARALEVAVLKAQNLQRRNENPRSIRPLFDGLPLLFVVLVVFVECNQVKRGLANVDTDGSDVHTMIPR